MQYLRIYTWKQKRDYWCRSERFFLKTSWSSSGAHCGCTDTAKSKVESNVKCFLRTATKKNKTYLSPIKMRMCIFLTVFHIDLRIHKVERAPDTKLSNYWVKFNGDIPYSIFHKTLWAIYENLNLRLTVLICNHGATFVAFTVSDKT